MNHVLFVCVLCIGGASVAQAQLQPQHPVGTLHQLTGASDPRASVPLVIYRSVFKETSLGVETDTVDWRKANNDVGKFTRGHVDILKAEEQDEMTKPVAPSAHKH